jgi:hypothetical protein
VPVHRDIENGCQQPQDYAQREGVQAGRPFADVERTQSQCWQDHQGEHVDDRPSVIHHAARKAPKRGKDKR